MKKGFIIAVAIIFCLSGCSQKSKMEEPIPLSSGSISDNSSKQPSAYSHSEPSIDEVMLSSQTGIELKEYYRKLRETVPYPGLAPMWFGDTTPYTFSPVDDTGRKLEFFLNYVVDPIKENEPSEDFDNDYMLSSILNNAVYQCVVNQLIGSSLLFSPELEPIALSVGNGMILKEHVDAAAKEIYGEDVIIDHHSILLNDEGLGWIWHEVEGVYLPPEAGGGVPVTPFVFNYTDNDDYYVVEAIFYYSVMWHAETEEEKNLGLEFDMEKVGKIRPRLQYTIKKGENGKFTVQSMRYLSEDEISQ